MVSICFTFSGYAIFGATVVVARARREIEMDSTALNELIAQVRGTAASHRIAFSLSVSAPSNSAT